VQLGFSLLGFVFVICSLFIYIFATGLQIHIITCTLTFTLLHLLVPCILLLLEFTFLFCDLDALNFVFALLLFSFFLYFNSGSWPDPWENSKHIQNCGEDYHHNGSQRLQRSSLRKSYPLRQCRSLLSD